MNGTDHSFPLFYDIDGDGDLLEFCIALFSLDQSVSTFLAKALGKSEEHGNLFSSSPFSLSPYATFDALRAKLGEDRLEERRIIRWMEQVQKPTIGIAQFGVADMAQLALRPTTNGKKASHHVEEEKEEEKDAKRGKNGKEGQREGVPMEAKVPQGESDRQRPPMGGGPSTAVSHRIFTLCDSETTFTHHVSQEGQPAAAVGGGGQPTRKNYTKIRQRKVGPKGRASMLGEPNQFVSSEQQRTDRSTAVMYEQRMRIMAYLGSDHIYDPSEEYLLWDLRLLNGRRLATDWDLDKIRTVTSVKTGNVFLAQLTVNEPTVLDELGREEEEDNSSTTSWKDGEEAEEEAEGFKMPDQSDEYWVHWMLEVGRGVGFLHENLRVEWVLELSNNWQCLWAAQQQPLLAAASDEQQQKGERTVQGMSQRCAVKSERMDDVANFGCPVEFSLTFGGGAGPPATVESEMMHNSNNCWPRILFTVTAEDNWGRIYMEGFANLALPITPGPPFARHIWLDCVRPISPLSKVFALRAAHLGQAEELAQLKAMGEQMMRQEGMGTELGGKLEIKIQCIHQSRHYISHDILRSLKYSAMMRRIGISGELQCRIAKVLEEFDRVRRQLNKLRKSRRPMEAAKREAE